jgi:two-component system phosphate regulon sensor histidine kinase PhoR
MECLHPYSIEENFEYILTNEQDIILYYFGNSQKSLKEKIDRKNYFEIETLRFNNRGEIIIWIQNRFAWQNRAILLFFTLLWISFCLVTLGFMVYIWEKQRRMQKIRLDVINNMSHEFKTPLTSIQLISEMILQHGPDLKDEKLKHYAGIIHQETDKMLQQAKQILNSAYYDQSKVILRKRIFNIHGLIEYILNSYTTVYNVNEISVSLSLSAGYPFVLVDRNHFINVLTNLLDNARKYSKNGHVHVCFKTYNVKNKIFIEVQDNGIGIETKYQNLIFERFYRVPSGNIHEKSGYGVGLYYVKTILKQMNADIRVKSKPGEGSVFIIQFKKANKHFKKSYNHGER